MNERIQELAEQAYEQKPLMVVNPQTYEPEHKIGNGGVPMYTREFNKEKFAELIVRECVTIINHGIDHTDYPHPNDTEKSMIEMKAQIWCRDAIKEHFGVDV